MIQNDLRTSLSCNDCLDAIIDNRGVVYRETDGGAHAEYFFVVIVIANSQRRLALSGPCQRPSFP